MNDNECVHVQKREEPRVSLERVGTRSGKSRGISAREDKMVPVPGPSVSLARCDSASFMASGNTVSESTTASIAGRKRQIDGEDSNSSGLEMMEVGEPKKPRGKKLPQDTQDADSGL